MDQITVVVLQTGMFLGGIVSLVLDVTLPGNYRMSGTEGEV